LAAGIFLFLMIGCGSAFSQTPPPLGPDVAWAQQFISPAGSSAVKGVAVDSIGNVYIGGEFYSGTELKIGDVALTNHDAQDGFLAKLDRLGNVVWVKQMTGNQPDGIASVRVDAFDSVYVLGLSRSSIITFGETNLTGQGDTDYILAKLDAAGNFVWVKQGAGPGVEIALGLGVSPSGDCFLAGYFQTTPTANFDGVVLTNRSGPPPPGWPYSSDGFLAKYDSNGNLQWAQVYDHVGDSVNCPVAADADGNCYVSGFISKTSRFGDTTLQPLSQRNIFVAKYDPSGRALWAKQFGGKIPGDGSENQGTCLAVDVSGNVLLTGFFGSTVAWFDGIALTNYGGKDVFVAKLTPNGDVIWARSSSGTVHWFLAPQIASDCAGNVYQSCVFDSPQFQVGTSVLINQSTNDPYSRHDFFIARYGSAGDLDWVHASHGGGDDRVRCLAADSAGNIYSGGNLNASTLTFGETGAQRVLSATNGSSFLLKLDTTTRPALSYARNADNLVLSWNGLFPYRLESQVGTIGSGQWIPASGTLSTNGSTNLVAVPFSGGNRFFRLVRP
jgi:hypothetical protein